MESEYKNSEATKRKGKIKMSGARTKRYHRLLRMGFSSEEAIEKSKDPINHLAIDKKSNEEDHSSFELPSHPDCKRPYRELKNMSFRLPTAKLRSKFYYQTHVLGNDPDQVMKTMLADPSVKEPLDNDELVSYKSRSISDKVTRPSTSSRHNTHYSRRTPAKGSSRYLPEGGGGSSTEECERLANDISSFVTGRLSTPRLSLPGTASSSRMTWDDDRLPFDKEEPYDGGYQPPRRDRSYPESYQDRQDFGDSRTEYIIASTSQMAWNEFNFPREHESSDEYEPRRCDRSHSGSELDREDIRDVFDPLNRGRVHCDSELDRDLFRDSHGPSRHNRSHPASEQDQKDALNVYGPPQWERSHLDSELVQEDPRDPLSRDRFHDSKLNQDLFRDSYGPSRDDRAYVSSERDQKDFLDVYSPLQWETSRPDSDLDQGDLRDNYDSLRPDRSYVGSELDRKDFLEKYNPPSRDRSHDGFADDRRNVHDRYDPPRSERSRRGSELDREDKYDPPRRDRSHRKRRRSRRSSSGQDRKDSRERKYDRPRSDRSHRRPEPGRKDSHDSPRDLKPTEDPTRSKTLKHEYESFLHNLKWSPPPHIGTASITGEDQRDPSSTRKRKVSTQVAPPSLVVVPLLTPLFPPVIKHTRLDQDSVNLGVSSLINPSRWTAPNEGTSEEVQSWKQDYQRFLSNESWKQDYKRFLENISKAGTTSEVSRGQTSQNNSPGQSKEVRQPKLGTSVTQKRLECNASTQPRTNEPTEGPTHRNEVKRTPPRSQQDRECRDGMRPALIESSKTAERQSTREQDRRTPRHYKELGSNKQFPSGSSSSKMASPKISTAGETEDRGTAVFIVPTNYPKVHLTDEQMDAVESSILEAILDINDESMKPSFKESFRRAGKYGVVCNDQFSKSWLYKYIQTYQPWPNASLEIKSDSTKVRVSVKLPLCKNDDNEKILRFIIKQNSHLNAKDWTVFHRLDTDSSTSVMFLVDEESVSDIRKCGRINFKMGRVDFVIEAGPELGQAPSGTGLSLGAGNGGSAPNSRAGSSQQDAILNSIPVNIASGSERYGPRTISHPSVKKQNMQDLQDSSFGVARNNMDYSSPSGHSGFSDPLRLPPVLSTHMERSRIPEPPRDHPTLFSPPEDQPMFLENPNHPRENYCGEHPTPNLGEQGGNFEASKKSPLLPSPYKFPQQMLEPPPPPLLGDALVTRNRGFSGFAERSRKDRYFRTPSPEPASSRSDRRQGASAGGTVGLSRRSIRSRSPDRFSHPAQPDRIPTSSGIIRRDPSHRQLSSRSPPPSRNGTSRH